MTRDQVEHIKRAAESARALKVDPTAEGAFKFRALDIFARLMTPEAVIELCDRALGAEQQEKIRG